MLICRFCRSMPCRCGTTPAAPTPEAAFRIGQVVYVAGRRGRIARISVRLKASVLVVFDDGSSRAFTPDEVMGGGK